MKQIISHLHVRARNASSSVAILQLGHVTVPCIIGRSGIATRKREGDGKTPAGHFLLRTLYRRNDRERPFPCQLAQLSISKSDGWCDDQAHRSYNKLVRLPFDGSHEKLYRTDGAYDLVIVVDYNLKPCVKGRGSAIFFHLTRPGVSATDGCVAISARHMRMIAQVISRRTRLSIGG